MKKGILKIAEGDFTALSIAKKTNSSLHMPYCLLSHKCLPMSSLWHQQQTILCGNERHEMRRIEDGLGKSWKVVNILLMKHSAQYCLLLLSLVTININFLITQTRCHAARRQRGITVRGQRGYCKFLQLRYWLAFFKWKKMLHFIIKFISLSHLASFTGKCAEMKARGRFTAHFALLIHLKWDTYKKNITNCSEINKLSHWHSISSINITIDDDEEDSHRQCEMRLFLLLLYSVSYIYCKNKCLFVQQ